MLQPVAFYRGIEIKKSHVVLCVATRPPGVTGGLFEARVGDWLLVGSLQSIKDHIDRRVGCVLESPRAEQLTPAVVSLAG